MYACSFSLLKKSLGSKNNETIDRSLEAPSCILFVGKIDTIDGTVALG